MPHSRGGLPTSSSHKISSAQGPANMGGLVQRGTKAVTSSVSANTPTRLVLFHKENHNLSRSGKPMERVRRLNEIIGWFDKYLKA